MILVLGGDGYIGSVLQQMMDVEVYDLKRNQDICDIDQLYPKLNQADSVVHLAGFSRDQAVDARPGRAWKTNYLANQVISDLLKYTNKKIVFASSCSVYGDSSHEWVDEGTVPNPLLMYARAKVLSEDIFLEPRVNGVALRFATVYGLSPQMRWDLVVNTMVKAAKEGKITVEGGEQWRPLVYVKDVCRAIRWALHADKGVYNVGSSEQNFQIKDLAQVIAQELQVPIEIIPKQDQRSYRVRFDKILQQGFVADYDIKYAVKEIYESL